MKRTWIVSELFYPDQASTGYIMTCIAQALSEDREVHVICGPGGYDHLSTKSKVEVHNFIIHRVSIFNFNKNNVIGRAIRLFLLSLGLFFKGLFLIRRGDTVLIVTNPAFIIPFYALISKLRHFDFNILVHDVFPENLISSGLMKSDTNVIYRITKKVFDWSYRQSSSMIVLGVDMLEVMRAKTSSDHSISIIENWSNIRDIGPMEFHSNDLIKELKLKNKIVFTFAGNIGRVQGLEFLFRIIRQVENPLVSFLFIGDGALLKVLKSQVLQYKIKSVTFAGSMPRSKQNLFLNASHCGLVTLAGDLYGLGVPSKSYNILAAGKPILFIGNKQTEIAKMVVKNKCGYVYDESEENELVTFFNQLTLESIARFESMGLISRRLAESDYSKDYILDKFRSTIK